MGVISKNDRKIGRFNSESNESLHIPQYSEEDDDAESGVSEVQQPITSRGANRSRRRVWPSPVSFSNPRRRLGKKRSRRYENVFQLETLVEDEELNELSIQDFIPDSSGGFSSLFENDDALEVWEHFINSPEDQQQQIINMQREAQFRNSKQSSSLPPTGEVAYKKIASGLRSKLRRCRVPLGIVEPLENDVVSFFSSSPTDIYVSDILTSFQRLLLHAVAQYHGLTARSFDSAADNLRLVKISNTCTTYQKPCVMLVQFLAEKRSL